METINFAPCQRQGKTAFLAASMPHFAAEYPQQLYIISGASRPLTSDEAQSFPYHIRCITGILALHLALDAHYAASV